MPAFLRTRQGMLEATRNSMRERLAEDLARLLPDT